MAKQSINVGSSANDRQGDSLRAAFQKVNANFTELYTALGLATDVNLNLGAFEFAGSVMTTTDSTPVTIDQQVNITSDLVMSGSVVPATTDVYDLGSPTKQWRSLYVTNNTVYFGGIPLSVTDDGTIIVNGQVAATPSGSTTWDSISGKPTIPTVVSDLTNDTGYLTQEDLVAEVTDGGNTARAGLSYSTSSVSIGAVQDPDGDFNSLSATVTAAGGEVTLRASQENNGDPQITSIGELTLNTGMFIVGIADGINPGAEIIFTQDNLTIPVPIVSPADTAFSITTADSNNGDPIINEFIFGTDGSITFPDSTTQTTAYTGDYNDLTNKPIIPSISNFTFSGNNILNTIGDIINIQAPFSQLLSTDGAYIWVEDGYGAGIEVNSNIWKFDASGGLIFPDTTVQTTAWTGSAPGFTYNENGETSEISVTADVFDFGDGKTIDMQNSSILFTGSNISGISDLTLSGDIRSETDINIDINLSDSTLRRWRFGEDGNLTLPAGGDILDSTGSSVLGGSSSPIQPYLELTNSPFIIQPVTFGEPFTVTAPVSGQGATFDVVITSGPLLLLITVNNAGTGYVAGQRYKIWHNVIGGTGIISDITFEIETVGELGEILTIINPQFASESPDNIPNTYTGVSIELYSSVRDEISPDVILTRGRVQGLYNIVSETEYDNNSYVSPVNTEWNSDGWDNLVGIGSRSFTTFRSALNNYVGENIIGAELVMRDVINDRYYKFEFTDWGQNNGGSYSYTRTEITDPNFFRKTDDGDEVDIFVADDGEGAGIGITRGGQQGIYNPYRDEGWDGDFTPSGTEWNIDGWDDLSDVESRTYTNFFAAYGNGGLGNRVPGSKAVMYIPETDTYYAIQWLSWTQNANGGGFTYVRYELDLTKLNEGVRFPDGSVLKSAEGVGRVKSTASAGRRIEEAVGSNTVSVTSVTTTNITATASRTVEGDNRFWVSTASEIFPVIDSPNAYDIQDYATIQFSLDNVTWYTYNGGYSGSPGEIGVSTNGSHTYNQGDTIYFRYDSGGAPQVWWDKNDLPAGGGNFRGAVIDYHAYTGEATIIGTIHIVDDSGEEHISHTEVASGSTDSENDDLWLVQNEGTISYRRIDGESKTLKIHWTAKVFYGTEFYD